MFEVSRLLSIWKKDVWLRTAHVGTKGCCCCHGFALLIVVCIVWEFVAGIIAQLRLVQRYSIHKHLTRCTPHRVLDEIPH